MATTPLRGDRAAHDMAFADLHATDIENEEYEYHVPPASAQTAGYILKASATGWVAEAAGSSVAGFQDISITGAGTATWDLAGGSAEITLDGNTTIAISNPGSVEGLIVFLKIATSDPAYTIAFNSTSFYFPNGIIPVISPINTDILTFACDGTNLYNIAHVQELDTAFSPDLLEDLMLWLDADQLTGSDDDPISSWTDASGNGYDFESADNAYRPLLKLASINGHKSLLFDNTDDALVDTTGMPMGYSGYTLFLVAKATSTTTTEHDILTDGASSRVYYDDSSWVAADAYGAAYFTPSPVTDPVAITIRKEFGLDNYVVAQYRANGVQDGIRADAGLEYGIGIGESGGTKHVNASVAEIIIYARTLTDREMLAVEKYLMTKYGIS